MSDKRVAIAWPEEVWFAECPECKESVDLGSDASFSEGDDATCDACGCEFWLPAQGQL